VLPFGNFTVVRGDRRGKKVPLITAGNPETAAGGGNVTDAPGDGARAAEETTGPTPDEERVNRATGPSDEVKRIEVAVRTVYPAPASPGVVAVPEVNAAPVPDENAVTVNTEENAGGDTSETTHAAELEAALLAASSPGREGPTEPAAAAAAAPTEAPVIAAEAEV
jgi:hypothetical protein